MTDDPMSRGSRRALPGGLRTKLAIGAALVVGLTGSIVIPGISNASSTLGSAAAASGRVFGTAVANSHLSESAYVDVLDTEFTSATPENEMKWDTTEPSQGSFNYTSADAIVSHAQSNGMVVRGHTLVWHSQLPSWVSSITDSSTLLSVMQNHISNVAGHFAGDIQYWDVVNEAFDGASRRSSVFQNVIGDSYIEEAFIAARAADPNAKLCYNDYSTDGINSKSTAVYDMVVDFLDRGVPIDCVGFQAHLVVGQVPSDFQANLQRFADLGIDVNITELDIRMATPATEANLTQQAADYQTVVSACLNVSGCTSITTWGITDKYSWVPDTFSGYGAALLFDDSYNKKAAYTSVLTALGGTSETSSATATSSSTGTTSSCSVTYATNSWNTGLTANITIANTGSSSIDGWELVFTLPSGQTITSGWNATYSATSGTVAATNASHNGVIAAGGSTDIGFQATHTGDTSAPTSFTLNGVSCTSA